MHALLELRRLARRELPTSSVTDKGQADNGSAHPSVLRTSSHGVSPGSIPFHREAPTPHSLLIPSQLEGHLSAPRFFLSPQCAGRLLAPASHILMYVPFWRSRAHRQAMPGALRAM